MPATTPRGTMTVDLAVAVYALLSCLWRWLPPCCGAIVLIPCGIVWHLWRAYWSYG